MPRVLCPERSQCPQRVGSQQVFAVSLKTLSTVHCGGLVLRTWWMSASSFLSDHDVIQELEWVPSVALTAKEVRLLILVFTQISSVFLYSDLLRFMYVCQ